MMGVSVIHNLLFCLYFSLTSRYKGSLKGYAIRRFQYICLIIIGNVTIGT